MTEKLELLHFEEALARAGASKRHLLLGNGFSIALKPDIFTYGALYDGADFTRVPYAERIFDALETRDFEAVIKTLVDMARVLEVYAAENADLRSRIARDAAAIKEILVDAIASRHPSRPFRVEPEQYQHCRRFLYHFQTGNVYTLNYDVLLYWTLMQREIDDLDLHCDDGFRAPEDDPHADYVSWQAFNQPTVHYLHGALHLFDAGAELQKYTWSRTDVPIIDQIRHALDEERYPLFVSEGTSRSKLERITHSGYLHKALRSLESIGGDLFVYGHSLADNDEHVLRAIEHGKVTSLFVSLYGDPTTERNQHIIKRAEAMRLYRAQRYGSKRPLRVAFYDAQTANVWGPTE